MVRWLPLALNLAHDIITDDKSVEEARQAYGEMIQQKMAGETPDYMTGFAFPMSEGDTTDPDVTTIHGNDGQEPMSNEAPVDTENEGSTGIENEAPTP